jgi:DNA-binding response OmpR family regulator
MKKVLLVDDEKNILTTLNIYLSREGYNVMTACDGIEAIKNAFEFLPDIIFLDIILPGIDGYLVCKALKAEENTKNIPVVFMSAKSEKKDMEDAFEAGCDDYLVKPFRPENIKNTILKLIGGN